MTTRSLCVAMIAFLIITCGFVLSPTPQNQAAPSSPPRTVSTAAVSNAGDTLAAAAEPTAPDRSSTCPQCSRPGPLAASIVQLFAAQLLTDLPGTALPAGEASYASTLPASQSDPHPLERPPAA